MVGWARYARYASLGTYRLQQGQHQNRYVPSYRGSGLGSSSGARRWMAVTIGLDQEDSQMDRARPDRSTTYSTSFRSARGRVGVLEGTEEDEEEKWMRSKAGSQARLEDGEKGRWATIRAPESTFPPALLHRNRNRADACSTRQPRYLVLKPTWPPRPYRRYLLLRPLSLPLRLRPAISTFRQAIVGCCFCLLAAYAVVLPA